MFSRSIITRLTFALIIVCAALLFITSVTLTPADAVAAWAAARPSADLIVNPGESIQAAIDAANDGDTIIVNAGDYTESLTLSKPVSLTGVNSDTTIIHAVAGQRVLTVTGATITNSVVISGLTFTGGYANFGGGLLADSPMNLISVRLISNTAYFSGGGLNASKPVTISHSWLEANHALDGSGGGFVTGDPLFMVDTHIVGNTASEGGGGYVVSSTRIINSWFERNDQVGLADYSFDAPLTISNSTFVSNSGSSTGGGALLQYSTVPAFISGSYFEGNYTGYGGGILSFRDTIVTDTRFISNTAVRDGGGAALFGHSTVEDSYFERNVSLTDVAGGLYGSEFVIRHTTFLSNSAPIGGALVGFGIDLADSHFEGNSASDPFYGGGAILTFWPLSISDTQFVNNRALHDGGAIYAGNVTDLTATRFISNSANHVGGSVFITGTSDARIINSLFARNRSGQDGAALYFASTGNMTVSYATIANTIINPQSAIAVVNGVLDITNTLITNHATGIDTITGTVTEDYNLFYGNITNTVGVSNGAHSLIGDPRFIDPAHDDYHLAFGSAAIDHGVDAGVYTDLDGNVRPQGAGFDIGAYEFTGGTRYVATTGDDASNLCLDQLAPCSTLQHAIDVANDGEQVLIASGTYTDMSVRPRNDITTTGVVTQVAYLSKTLTLRGGYTLTNWLTPDLSINQTILDAQAQGRVFYITGNISPTIEGLRLTNGTGILSDNYCEPFICYIPGGAIYAVNATVELIDSMVDNNAGGYEGAAIFVADGHASLRHNVVMSNLGGGVTLFNSDGLITDNQIISNMASNGGGILVLSGTATLLHNDILTNTASYAGGGGVCIAYGSTATVDNNVIRDNRAIAYGGGGVEVFDAQAVLRNNLIEGNFVNSPWGYSSGGGVSVDATGHAELIENTIRHNVVSGSFWARGGGVDVDGNSSVTMTRNLIENNAASQGGGLSVARLSTATVANNLFVNDIGSSEIYVTGGEAHLLHNTLAGNASSTSLDVTTYQDSQTPPTFSTVALTNTLITSYTVGVNVSQGNTVTLNSLMWHGTPITISQTGTATVIAYNEIYGDPRFIDPAHDDYHLAFGSAAIDRGVDAGVYTDLDGNLRPQGAGFDIGAYEYPTYRAFLPILRR